MPPTWPPLSGELSALISAILLAASSVILTSQTRDLDALTMNLIRTVAGAALFFAAAAVSGSYASLLRIPPLDLLWLAASVALSVVSGDTLLFLSMRTIGVGRALPINSTYPLFTIAYSALFVADRLDPTLLAGAFLVVAGVVLVARRAESREAYHPDRAAIAYAVLSAALLGLSIVLLRLGLRDTDVITAGLVRLPIAALALGALRLSPLGVRLRAGMSLHRSHLGIGLVILAGLLGTGLSTYFFLTAVKFAGPTRTSIIAASTPLLSLAPGYLILKEPLTWRVVIGTLAMLLGVCAAILHTST